MLARRRCVPRITALAASAAIASLLLAGPGAYAQSSPADRLVLQQLPTTLTSPTQALFAAPQGTLFAQLTSGGFERSDDSGQTWRSENLPAVLDQAELRQVTLDGTGHSVAFARVARDTRSNGLGRTPLYTLLRARAGDPTWTSVPAPPDPNASVDLASPANPDVLYAPAGAVDDGSGKSVRRTWRSRDGGATWEVAEETSSSGPACRRLLQPHPTDSQLVFSPGLSCAASIGSGAPSAPSFEESRDQASTWADYFSTKRLTSPADPTRSYGRVTAVTGGFNPNPRAFLAQVTYDPREAGPGEAVFRSLDDGLSWNPILYVTPWDRGARLGGGRLPVPALGTAMLDPRNPDRLLLNGGRLSDDGGKTWYGGPALDPSSSIVTTPDGWFASTPAGVVRLALAHQPVSLPDRWRVLANDLDQPAAVALAPDGSVLVGDRRRVRRLTPDGQVLGEWSSSSGVSKPVDALAQDDRGQIWVAQRSAHVAIIGADGSDTSQLDLPAPYGQHYVGGVALDGVGGVYLTQQPDTIPADNPPRAVLVVSAADGSMLAQWGSPGTDPGAFSAVTWGTAIDGGGNLYVADAANNRVQELAPDGSPLTTWGGLQAPAGIALDGAGNLYVAESLADRIVELAPDGTQVGSWGTSGSGLGQFWQPLGVAVDASSGTIYAADTLNNRLVRIDPGP